MTAAGGSATRHWRNQRLTSIALVPLGLWFAIVLLALPDFTHATVMRWLAHPLQAGLMALLAAAALWHSMQGLQVVVEDYVGGRSRVVTLVLLRLLHLVAALAAAWAIATIALAGGA